MQDLIKHTSQLPVKLEDLAKFVLVGREKLTAVRALIKAMDKIEVAAEVRKQKRDEAQMLAEALLDAEARIGELANEIPKAAGGDRRSKDFKIDTAVDYEKSKTEIIKELGFEQKQIERYQTLAENKDIIEQAKAEARENDDIVNRTMVLNAIKEKKKEEDKQQKIDEIKSKAFDFDSNDIKVFNMDFRQYEWKQGEIDLILTDPPYPAEFLPLWGDLFKIAKKALKPHGFLVAYSGQMYLDKIFQMALEAGMDYYWMMNIEFTKKPLVHGRKVLNEWKPILVFQNGLKQHDRVFSDKIKMDYTERDMHDLNWGQTIEPFKFLLDRFSDANDMVFEPFAGTGTTLIACQQMKRRCVGTEMEEKYIDLIKGRLNEGHMAQ